MRLELRNSARAAKKGAVTEPGSTQKPADEARTAGRGGIAIAVAKVSFIVLGLVQQILLPWLIGVERYGEISLVLSGVSVVNNVIVAASIFGVSRMVAGAHAGEEEHVFRRVLAMHAVLAVGASIAFAAAAGLVAGLQRSPAIETPLRITAGVVLCYGVYAPMVGSLNGRKRFFDQAGLDIFYGLSRTILLVGGASIGLWLFGGQATTGAMVGFVAAAVLIVPIAATRSGLGEAGGRSPTAEGYASFVAPVVFAQLGLNLLLQTDYFLLARAAGEEALRVAAEASPGASAEAVEEEARLLAGHVLGVYRGVQLFGFLPYQLLMAVQFVLFPMLARARQDGDAEAVKRLVRSGVRIALFFTGLVAGTIAALGPHAIRLVYPGVMADGGGDAVRVYAPGFACFAILGVVSAALTSLGRERWSALLNWMTVLFVGGVVLATRPSGAFDKVLVDATAYAAAGGMAVAVVVAALLLRFASGAFVAPLTLVRVLFAFGVTTAMGRLLPWMGKPFAVVEAVAMAALYVAVLVVTRELGRRDLDLVRAVVGRSRGKGA
jgi:stage V sporulation protein B